MLDPHAGFRVPHADPYVKLCVRSTHQLQTQVGGAPTAAYQCLDCMIRCRCWAAPLISAANALQSVGLQTALLPNWLCSCPYLEYLKGTFPSAPPQRNNPFPFDAAGHHVPQLLHPTIVRTAPHSSATTLPHPLPCRCRRTPAIPTGMSHSPCWCTSPTPKT